MKILQRLSGVSEANRIIIALVLGLAVGFVFHEKVAFLRILGDIFLKMIKMVIVPLVFISIVNVFCSMKSSANMGRVAFKCLVMHKVATVVTASFGIAVAVWLKPGVGINISPEMLGASVTEPVQDASNLGFSQMFLHIFPENIFESFVRGDIIQIIFFAACFGIAITKLENKVDNVKSIIDSLAQVIYKLIGMIIKLTPIGIFGIMAYLAGTQELKTLKSLLYLVLVVYGCGLTVGYLLFGIVLTYFKLNPITFFKKTFKAQAFAFLTSSSSAAIPIAEITAHKRLGVGKATSSLAIPLGSAFNLSGTTLHLGVTAVFLSQIFGAELVFSQYVQIAVLSLMLTMGAVGIPSASLLMMPVILSAIGVPVEYVAVYVGVDRFLDMLRSYLNSTGDILSALIVEKSEGNLDEKVYNDMSL